MAITQTDLNDSSLVQVPLTGSQATSAIQKSHDIQSSASEIDSNSTIAENSISMDGDSICKLSAIDNLGNLSARGSFAWGNSLLGSPFKYISNFGVGGERTDEILSRISATLLTSAKYIHYIMGKNDVLQDKQYSDIISNMAQIFDATKSAGKIIIASTIIPASNDSDSRRELISKINLWMKSQVHIRRDFLIVDYYNAIVDYATGLAKTNMLISDGIHPSVEGAYYMGIEFKNTLSNKLEASNLFTNNNVVDSSQIVANSNFIGGTTIATNWYNSGGIASKTTIGGREVQAIKSTDDTTKIYIYQSIYDNFMAGDKITFIVEIELQDIVSLDTISLEPYSKDSNSAKIDGCSVLQISSSETLRFPNDNFSVVLRFDGYIIPTNTYRIIPNITAKFNGTLLIKRFQAFKTI